MISITYGKLKKTFLYSLDTSVFHILCIFCKISQTFKSKKGNDSADLNLVMITVSLVQFSEGTNGDLIFRLQVNIVVCLRLSIIHIRENLT